MVTVTHLCGNFWPCLIKFSPHTNLLGHGKIVPKHAKKCVLCCLIKIGENQICTSYFPSYAWIPVPPPTLVFLFLWILLIFSASSSHSILSSSLSFLHFQIQFIGTFSDLHHLYTNSSPFHRKPSNRLTHSEDLGGQLWFIFIRQLIKVIATSKHDLNWHHR